MDDLDRLFRTRDIEVLTGIIGSFVGFLAGVSLKVLENE